MEKGFLDLEKKEENYKVPNLEKGIAVLEYLSLNPHGKTLQEIKTDLIISQTTAYRILNTLVRLDYLLYNKDNKRYVLTSKLLSLGFRMVNQDELLEVVIPHMRQLRNELEETVCFGILGDKKGIFIDQVQGTHAFRFVLTPGKTFELHCSAPGKAIMAFLSPRLRREYLAQMTYQRYNENTITSERQFLEELERVARQGYALDNEEELHGVICVGAPIFNYSGHPCGAIWVSGPKGRLSADRVKEFAEKIKTCARLASTELGYYRK